MKKRKSHGDFREFILLILLKERALSLETLEEKISLFISYFALSGSHFAVQVFGKIPIPFRKKDLFKKEIFDKRHRDYKKIASVKSQCEELAKEGLLIKNKDNEYELTEKGTHKANDFKKDLEKGASFFESQIQNPQAATKNTFIANLFLTTVKLTTGLLSGSVGLLADGADSCVDTISASAVWLGIKFKKELFGAILIIIMMFFTGISVGVESISKLVQIFSGSTKPITHPLLVIFVEFVSMIFAAVLTLYQRYVGKRNGSFALISQSVDSKNHIFIAGAVILGTILSFSGLHFVDASIGTYISYRILKDAFGLTNEAFASIKGEKADLEKYKYPLEEQWHLSKLESFRLWVLYAIRENNLETREEIINNLKETFDPAYMPVISEFKFSLGKGFDFREKFDDLVKPLLEKDLIVKHRGKFSLTKEGEKHLDKKFHLIRYHEQK
jgi:cation diffusion facilitator family transporter